MVLKKSKGHTDLKNTHFIERDTESRSFGLLTVIESDGSININESLRGWTSYTFEELKIILNQTIAHLKFQCSLHFRVNVYHVYQ
jgi:hypothetical protein